MRKIFFFILILFCCNIFIYGNNAEIFLDLIEKGNIENIETFFSSCDIGDAEIFINDLVNAYEKRYGIKVNKEFLQQITTNLFINQYCPDLKSEIISNEKFAGSFSFFHKGCLRRKNSVNPIKPPENSYFPEEFTIPYVEFFAGVLLCLIPSGGVTQRIGAGLIIDAGRRTFDTLVEKERNQDDKDDSISK